MFRRSTRLAEKPLVNYKEIEEKPVVTPRPSRKPKEPSLSELFSKMSVSNSEATPIRKTCDELRSMIPLKRDSPSQEKPIAILLAGPAGAGKSTMLKKILRSNFEYDLYNVDDYQEKLLELNGILKTLKTSQGERLVNASEDKIAKLTKESEKVLLQKEAVSILQSIIATSMGISKKCTAEDFIKMIEQRKNIVIDRPGDKFNSIKEQIDLLKKEGYTVYMVVIYASPITALVRNAQRGRVLMSYTVSNIWKNLIQSLSQYQKLFGDRFYLINNDIDLIEYEELASKQVSITKENYKKLIDDHKQFMTDYSKTFIPIESIQLPPE